MSTALLSQAVAGANWTLVSGSSTVVDVRNNFIDFRVWSFLPAGCRVTIALSGANTLVASNDQAASNDTSSSLRMSSSQILTGLNNGSTTVMLYVWGTSGTVFPKLSVRTV